MSLLASKFGLPNLRWLLSSARHVGGLFVILCLLGIAELPAEVKSVALPSKFFDFAFNPQTGDLATIQTDDNTVALFPVKYLDGKAVDLVAPVKVGPNPVSICFKQFGEKAYFAVVCVQDSNLYLLDATDLKRIAKISLSGSVTTNVICSSNPEDPFIYYNGGGVDFRGMCGAVDLRTMSDQGRVAEGGRSEISANGRLLYFLSLGVSPTGFNAARMTTPFSASKPVFQVAYHEHTSVSGYFPDPLGLYTAVGPVIYTDDLKKRVASLNFNVVAVAKKPPLIMGFRYDQDQRNLGVLQAVSYNSFRTAGNPVPVSKTFVTTPQNLGPENSPNRAMRHLFSRVRVFPDETRGRLVCASLNQVCLIPFTEFEAPDEPLLHVTTKSPTVYRIGEPAKIKLDRADPRVELQINNLPDGAKVTGDEITWTPTSLQVGIHNLELSLKQGELERTQKLPITVESRKVALPFSPTGIALSPSGKTAVVWTNQVQPPGPVAIQFAVVDLAKMKVGATRTEGLANVQVDLDEQHIYLREAGGAFVQVHELDTLKRLKTLYSDDTVERIFVYEGKLVTSGRSRMSAYSIADWSRIKVPVEGPCELRNIGVVWNNAVLDKQLKNARLLLNSTLPTLGNPPNGMRSGRQSGNSGQYGLLTGEARQIVSQEEAMRLQVSPGNVNPLHAMVAPVLRASLELQSTGSDNIQAAQRLSLSLKDWLRGAEVLRLPLAEKEVSREYRNPQQSAVRIAATASRVIAAWDNDLYAVDLPAPLPAEFKSGLTAIPSHSQLDLSSAKNGIVKLSHQPSGGTAPYTLTFAAGSSGLEIDEKTGEVQVNVAEVQARALELLSRTLAAHATASAPTVVLDEYLTNQGAAQETLIGRKLTGAPVFLPLHIRIQDTEGQLTELRYGVIVEVPLEPLKARLKTAHEALVAERAAMIAKSPPTKKDPAEPTATPPADDSEDLSSAKELRRLGEKIEVLEARIDLLTRQLAELIKLQTPSAPATPKSEKP